MKTVEGQLAVRHSSSSRNKYERWQVEGKEGTQPGIEINHGFINCAVHLPCIQMTWSGIHVSSKWTSCGCKKRGRNPCKRSSSSKSLWRQLWTDKGEGEGQSLIAIRRQCDLRNSGGKWMGHVPCEPVPSSEPTAEDGEVSPLGPVRLRPSCSAISSWSPAWQ